jgi:hypothetical protein
LACLGGKTDRSGGKLVMAGERGWHGGSEVRSDLGKYLLGAGTDGQQWIQV